MPGRKLHSCLPCCCSLPVWKAEQEYVDVCKIVDMVGGCGAE